MITREYALFCCGRYVSQAVGEHTFYGQGNMVYGRAMEAARSNALVRCCKDLGIASELWDPKVIQGLMTAVKNTIRKYPENEIQCFKSDYSIPIKIRLYQ